MLQQPHANVGAVEDQSMRVHMRPASSQSSPICGIPNESQFRLLKIQCLAGTKDCLNAKALDAAVMVCSGRR